MEYKGYQIVRLNDEEINNFYNDGYISCTLNTNEYLIIQDYDGNTIDYCVMKNGKLEKIKYPIITSEFSGKIKPRNEQQYCAMHLLKNDDIPIKLITGRFGSGKSLLCITAAMEALQKGDFEKIIFVRNNVQVKDTDALGALPGTETEKMLPYLMPFADHCGGVMGIEMLMNRGKLEVIPLGFLRGRSIRNAIIYSMESENLTKEHIQLLMGRVDEGSQLWLDGDIKQRDRISFERSKGLETMVERLKGNSNFGYVHLEKSERSKVAALADLLD